MYVVKVQRWVLIMFGFSTNLTADVWVGKWTVVSAELFVLAWSKQAKQECAFLCLNKEMGNHDIIPGPPFFLSSYRSFFIWTAQVYLFAMFVDSEHLRLLSLLALV